MNNEELKAILSKKHPTGYEVGLLLFSSVINNSKDRKQIDPKFQKAFTIAEASLNEKEREIYTPYSFLYNSILDAYNKGVGQFAKFISSYYFFVKELSHLISEFQHQLNLYSTPLIVTESEYNALYKQTMERMLQEGNTGSPDYAELAKTIKLINTDKATAYYKYTRAAHGIAVVKNVGEPCFFIDSNGNYKDSEFKFAISNIIESYSGGKEVYKFQHRRLKEVLTYTYSFNCLLGIIEEVYKIPKLQESLSLTQTGLNYEKRINDYASQFAEARADFAEMCNSETTIYNIERDNAILEEVFQKYDFKQLHPTKKSINAMKKSLEGIGFDPWKIEAYKNLQPFIDQLRPEDK